MDSNTAPPQVLGTLEKETPPEGYTEIRLESKVDGQTEPVVEIGTNFMLFINFRKVSQSVLLDLCIIRSLFWKKFCSSKCRNCLVPFISTSSDHWSSNLSKSSKK